MKVLITPRSYGKGAPELFEMLKEAGLEIVSNDTGGVLDKETMKEKIRDCDGVILGIDPFDAEVIAEAPKLRAIARYGVGTDNIDMEAAKNRGIKVSRTAGANADAVADYTVTLMLAVARKMTVIDDECRKGNWKKITTQDVSGATLGIFGLGAIGKNVAKRAYGFDMKILAYDPFWDEAFAEKYNIIRATPQEIYSQSDFITLHLPLTEETKNYIGREELAMMKPEVVLINTARGGLIDEEALLEALESGKIYGAGIDVFLEIPPKDPRWTKLNNVVLGSHCAASTLGAARNMGYIATENLLRDLGLKG